MANDVQFLRKASLLVVEGEKALDLSEMHFTFETKQADEESPNNCAIRIFNLSADTVKRIKGEYSKVVLQAGYVGAAFGVIFEGTIKQFREGKDPDGANSFLDILAADGDIAYNFALVNTSLAAGSSAEQRVQAAIGAMKTHGVESGKVIIPGTGGVLPRGKVLFGLARAALRQETAAQGTTWNINNGQVNVIPLDGYLPSEAVVLTSATGLIGRIEQTEQGMNCRALINPKLIIGGLVKIDNKSINTTSQAPNAQLEGGSQVPYNKWAGIQQFASLSEDGLYRIYVAEFVGDTRGPNWYVDLICLSVDPVTKKVDPYG